MKRFQLSVSCAALVISAGIASAATNSVYDLYVTPGITPPTPPWTVTIGAPSTQSVSSRVLTINDAAGGFVWNSQSLPGQLSSTATWEARARMRLLSYSDGPGRVGMGWDFEDGTRYMAIGARLGVGNVHEFFIGDSGHAPVAGVYTPAPNGDDFYNLRVRKVGTSGTAADTIELYVNDILAQSVSYTTAGGSIVSTPGVIFGGIFGGSAATAEVNGFSFGINEAAPALLPEPSAIALFAIGALLAVRRLSVRR